MHAIPEKNWKRLREKQEEKLDQASADIISRVKIILQSQHGSHYKTYLNIWDVIHAGDAGIIEMFDDLRRSNAVFKLASWQRHGLINESKFKEFSEETQASVDAINE